jgi:hypothetical protein
VLNVHTVRKIKKKNASGVHKCNFTQECQQSVLSEILGLTPGEVVWMQEGKVSPAISPTPSPGDLTSAQSAFYVPTIRNS